MSNKICGRVSNDISGKIKMREMATKEYDLEEDPKKRPSCQAPVSSSNWKGDRLLLVSQNLKRVACPLLTLPYFRSQIGLSISSVMRKGPSFL
jgi:hypothetical protein